ncbi:RHS repeat-associated core domain-containing protein [Actinomadura rubrisoli]|uniref:RHS repeat-associated core domain-containing protein n=1 Tax=Actinomadura rubrisoli TaxID=2530368 RepID=A0A4R5BC37_9ACTN|nr:RHS repeat-associated core domain-containing protein [Actinomadura rubrisoli]TDD82759.1 RHS repeat-associated core domain-containing protein [Actinomadura rubrisoli]
MRRRVTAWVSTSALLTAALAAPPGAAGAEPRPRGEPYRFQRLYPEIGSPNAARPRLGPSARGGVRLSSPGTVGDAAKTRLPARAPSGAGNGRAAAAPAAASVPVGVGPVRNGTFLSFGLADYLQLKVNVGSGNAMVRTTDMSLPGIGGNVTAGASYNSLLHAADAPTGVISPGWRTRVGQDVRLYKNSDNSVTYTGPDGTSGVFTPSGSGYTTPKEFKGDLVTQSGGGWKYTDHGSGRVSHFDSAGLPTKTADRNGNTTDFGYTSGHVSTITYKPKGETSGRVIKVGMYGGDRITSYTQDKAGGGSRIAAYSYDGSNRLAKIQEPAGEVIQFGYDASGNLNSITNGKGAVTRLAYDGNHRVLSVTRVGSSAAQVTRLAYPSDTRSQVADPNTDQSKPVADVPHTTYTLNANDRVTKTVDAAGKTRSKSYTPFSDIETYQNANQGLTSNTFGANGGESPTRSVSPTGASASMAYGNSPTGQNPTAAYQPSAGTDTQGNSSSFTYDGPGNLSSAKNALAAEAKVSYNPDGTVKDATDPGNGSNSTTYAYDGNHQLTSVTPPSGNSLRKKTFTYDGYGRLDTATDGNGKKTTYTYDNDDRVLTVAYSDGTPTVTFTYDKAGNVRTRTGATGTTTWDYTQRNLMSARQSTSGGGEIDWQYDATGNLVNQLNSAGTLHYVHSTRNLLASMTDYAGKKWEFDYDDDGNRTDTYFNRTSGTDWSMHTRTGYDDSGRVTRIVTSRAGDDSKVVSDVSYCYSERGGATSCDAAKAKDTGLRQWSRNNVTGTISDYTYDKGNRLTKATSVAGHTYEYGYDTDGNRTTVKTDGSQTQNLTFNSANQATTAGETYDAAGNLTATSGSGGLKGTYNAAGQTTQFTKGTTAIPYAYAGPDQTEMVSAKGTTVVYGRPDQSGSAGIDSYSQGSGTNWLIRDSGGTPLGYSDGSNPYAFGTDGLGSVTSIVSPSGTQAASYTYAPYGETTADNGWQSAVNLIRYTGGFSEPGSGLLKLGQRYYDAGRGRFTQQDAISNIGNPQNGNRYTYAGDDPINNVDPSGALFTQLWDAYSSYQDGKTMGGAVGDLLDGNTSVSQSTQADVAGMATSVGVAGGCMALAVYATGGLGAAGIAGCEVVGELAGKKVEDAVG